MKKLICLLFLLLFCQVSYAYDMSLPLEGQSIANDSLQYEVLNVIYPITAKLNPLCTEHKVTNTQVIHYPYNVKKKNKKFISGYWKELWSVNYCGETVQIPVTFEIKKNKTLFHIEKDMILQ